MHAPAAGRGLPALIACGALMLAGCASTAERHPADPWEPFNRGVYRFNDALDRGVLRPTAKAYKKGTPGWFQTGVGNFFQNLEGPSTIVNQLLQGKFREAGQDTGRLLLNLTFGLGGVIDVATMNEMPLHDEDFGQTLGWWGAPPGPFLMLPFLGPSTVRDAPSVVAERYFQPFYWYDYGNERWVALALSFIDRRARLLPFDDVLAETYDPYAFIRDAYLQRRQYLVFDGNPPDEPLEEFEDMEGVDSPATEPEIESDADPKADSASGAEPAPTPEPGSTAEPDSAGEATAEPDPPGH